MTTSLEDDIRTAFARQADRTTVDPTPEFGVRPLGPVLVPASRPRARVLVPLVAATLMVTVGGLVGLTRVRDDAPAPLAVPPASLADPATIDVRSAAIGLFPAGDVAAIVSAGYGTPQAAVDAYLADRTRPEVVPDGFDVTFAVSDLIPPRVADEAAIVGFSLATENGSGDGLLLVQQVAAGTDPERWVVMNGGIGTFTIDELAYRDGQLSGSFSNEIGGQTHIDVYDAITGERLQSTADNPITSGGAYDTLTGERVRSIPGNPFTFDGLTSPAVTVRFWNTVADGDYEVAVFAEALVHDGERVSNLGESALHDQYYNAMGQRMDASTEPFDNGPISAFHPDGGTGTVTIVDDPQINIDAQVQLVERTGHNEYCLAITWAGREVGFDTPAACFSPEVIAAQQDIGNGAGLGGPVAVVDSLDGTQVLVIGAVPDAVTDVRTETAENITPTHNIWWDIIDAGPLVTYTIIASDGRTTELTAG